MKIFSRERSNEGHHPLEDDGYQPEPSSSDQYKEKYADDTLEGMSYPKNPSPKMRTFNEASTTPTKPPVDMEKDLEEASPTPQTQAAPDEDDDDYNDIFEDIETDAQLKRRKAKQTYRRLLLLSNLLFVLGSALYMVMAVDGLKWAKEAQSIPEDVLRADDDAAWVDYKTQEALAEMEQEQEQEVAWLAENDNNNNNNNRRLSFSKRRRLTTYDSYDWQFLPPPAKEAATILGYDQTSWDTNGYVEEIDVYWNELTPEQQEAATTLGYTQAFWDGTDAVPTFSPTAPPTAPPTSPPTSPPTPPPTATEETPQEAQEAPQEAPQEAQEQDKNNIPNLPYDDVDWDDLPEDVLLAARRLGYTRNRWNNDLPPRIVTQDNPSWEEMTTNQQASAGVLGYSADTWWYIRRNYENFTVPIEQDVSDQISAAANDNNGGNDNDQTGEQQQPTGPDEDWDNYAWDELPADAQAAFQVLGYDEDGNMWDNEILAETESLGWEEMSQAQREAALFLGYSQAEWDGVEETSAPTTEATLRVLTYTDYEEYEWNDMPPEIRLAYTVLGYNRQIWSEGGTSPTSDMYWEDLTVTQRAAALTLGYTEDLWNGTESTTAPELEVLTTSPPGDTIDPTNTIDSMNDTIEPTETVTTETVTTLSIPDAQWYNYYWDDLPVEIQAAYEELGYDQQMWDGGDVAYTEDLTWEGLTPAQQEAAGSLGYTQAIWDGFDSTTTVSATGSQPDISWDDDYVFLVKSRNVWVSRYMILYFSAALCFVFTGLVDWFRERKIFHVCMILAGLFGVISAMLVEKDRTASMVFNCLSVHFFLLEGVNIIWVTLEERKHHQKGIDNDDNSSSPDVSDYSELWWIPTVEIVADIFFVLGALMDVVLSYFYFERSSDWSIPMARVFCFSMLLWIACSVMYLAVTLVYYFGWFTTEGSHPRTVQAKKQKQREIAGMNFVAPLPTGHSSDSG